MLLDLFLSGFKIAFQVQKEIRLLDHLKTFLQLVMLFHEIDDGLVSVLELTLSHTNATAVDG